MANGVDDNNRGNNMRLQFQPTVQLGHILSGIIIATPIMIGWITLQTNQAHFDERLNAVVEKVDQLSTVARQLVDKQVADATQNERINGHQRVLDDFGVRMNNMWIRLNKQEVEINRLLREHPGKLN